MVIEHRETDLCSAEKKKRKKKRKVFSGAQSTLGGHVLSFRSRLLQRLYLELMPYYSITQVVTKTMCPGADMALFSVTIP
jgi:hypothetical protein